MTIQKHVCKDCRRYLSKKIVQEDKGIEVYKVNNRQNELRKKATKKLLSEEGIKLRKKRCVEVKSIFGQIK